MAYNDIIKALKCCEIEDCHECFYKQYSNCRETLICTVLDFVSYQNEEIESLLETLSIFREDMHLLIDKNAKKQLKNIILQLEAEIESSEKYMRECDNSDLQKAYNQGLRAAYNAVKEMADE